ncbi:hypothetical protein FACS1894184_08420 [Clostridia bacterium]|nr:hypothetical protein FACS1894184_08420 [Clostridia bacterium]
MPTNKPRITFALSDDELDIVNRFMDANAITNQSSAVRAIIAMGINEYKRITARGKHQRFDLTEDAAELIDDYLILNREGKRVIKDVMKMAVGMHSDQPEPLTMDAPIGAHIKESFMRQVAKEQSNAKGTG